MRRRAWRSRESMSFYDDRDAEIEALLERARNKCAFGKKYSPAVELALNIKTLRQILAKKDISELNEVERRFADQAAEILLSNSITSSKKLRQVADALDATRSVDARQTNLLWAYEQAILTSYPPTLAAVKGVFVTRFGEQSWPVDWSARKTITVVLELPLAEDRRGPHRGTRQLIRNRKS